MPLLCVILIFTAAMPAARGEALSRHHLELELDEVQGVKGYEVKLLRIQKGKKKPPAIFKLKKSVWAADLVPGKYEMAVRSIDERGVPGEWSESQEILVKIPAPAIVHPLE